MSEDALLQDQPLGHKLIKKGFWLYFFSFLIAPAGYVIKVLISNSVSVADVGVLYTIVSLITFLNVYNDLGLTESLQYYLPRYWVKKQFDYIKTSIYLSLGVQVLTAILIAGLLWFGAPWLAENYFHSPISETILRYFCIYFLGINLFQVLQAIFVSFQNTFDYQFVDFVRMRSIVAFTVFFFLTGKHSIEWYSLNWVLGLGVGILVASIIFYNKYRKNLLQGNLVYDKPMLKEYVKYALRCFVGLNVGNIFGQIIQQMIIVMLGPEQAGYYTNFLSLFGIAGVIVGPIMGLIFPMVSELVTKKDTIKLSMLYSFFYTYFLVFCLMIALLLLILGPELAVMLFGKKFIFSGELLSWGALASIFTFFVGFNFSVLAGMGKIKERVKIMLISAAVVALLSWIGIYIWGIYGAIFAFVFGNISLFVLSFHTLYRDIQFGVDWLFIIKNIILASVLSVLIYNFKSDWFMLEDQFRIVNLVKLLVLGVIFVCIIIGVNYKKALLLKNEIRRMRS